MKAKKISGIISVFTALIVLSAGINATRAYAFTAVEKDYKSYLDQYIDSENFNKLRTEIQIIMLCRVNRHNAEILERDYPLAHHWRKLYNSPTHYCLIEQWVKYDCFKKICKKENWVEKLKEERQHLEWLVKKYGRKN